MDHHIVELEQDLTNCDAHIAELQLSLKLAKKAREEKIAELRGAIRDAARPMFDLLEQEAAHA